LNSAATVTSLHYISIFTMELSIQSFTWPALIKTRIAAKPYELGLWEWSHSTALRTVIIIPFLFFPRRYFYKQQQPR